MYTREQLSHGHGVCAAVTDTAAVEMGMQTGRQNTNHAVAWEEGVLLSEAAACETLTHLQILANSLGQPPSSPPTVSKAVAQMQSELVCHIRTFFTHTAKNPSEG